MCLELPLVNGWRFQSLHRSRNPLIIDARGIGLIADLIEESLAELTVTGPSAARQSHVLEGSLT